MKKHIHQSNLMAGIDNRYCDRVDLAAWWLLVSWKRLTEQRVLVIHRVMMSLHPIPDEYRGHYRDVPHSSGLGLRPDKVPRAMTRWLAEMRDKGRDRTARSMHVRFMNIHPFLDGNGRLGRMLMWWHERRQLKRLATVIYNEHKEEYYDWWK